MIIAIFTSILVIAAQSPEDKLVADRFLKEYPKFSAGLEARSSTMRGTARVLDPKNQTNTSLGTTVTFAVNGPIRKFEYTRMNGEGSGAQKLRYVHCMADTSSFRIESLGDGPFQIQGIGLDYSDQAVFRLLFGKYLDAPWVISGVRLIDLIQAKDFVLHEAQEIDSDRGRIVEVKFNSGSFNGRPDVFRVRLDPTIDWAIVESEYHSGSSEKAETMEIEYLSDPSGVRGFPKRIRSKGFDGKNKICEFEKVEFVPTLASEFRMDHYGLKDVTHYAPSKSSPLYGWLTWSGAILVLFTGSLALKKLADRRR